MIILVLAPLVCLWFAGIFYATWRTFSPANEWLTLAAEYRSVRKQGPSLHCWISLRFRPWEHPSYSFGEFPDGRITITVDGLQLTRWLFPFPWRPPLLIPWSDVGLIGRRGPYEYDRNRLIITFANVPAVRMYVSGDAADELIRLGAPFHVGEDGMLLADAGTVRTAEINRCSTLVILSVYQQTGGF